MHTPRSNDPLARANGRRAGAHRAPSRARWRWLLGVTLPVAVLTGAGLALAELPETNDSPAAAETVDTRLLGDDGPATSAPPDSGVVTQPAETPSSTAPESASPEPDSSSSDPGADEALDEMAAFAVEVVALTNQERLAAGCGEVVNNPQLAAAAVGHSRDMADNGYFDHSSQDGRSFVDRAVAAGYDHAMSENIAKGYPDAASVVKGWMDSPGHRDNLLNCDAKAVGIGVARDAGGALLWTQVFGRQ